jgi:hypothetical protein
MKTPTLRADSDSGEGDVKFPSGWGQLDGLLRADLLKDWIAILDFAYQDARSDMAKEEGYGRGCSLINKDAF